MLAGFIRNVAEGEKRNTVVKYGSATCSGDLDYSYYIHIFHIAFSDAPVIGYCGFQK